MAGLIIFILIITIIFYFYYKNRAKNRAEEIKRIERFNNFVNNFGKHKEEFQEIKDALNRMQIKINENKKDI